MLKLTNPLHYPVAVLAGGMILFLSVRIANLPAVVMLPVATSIATAGAVFLKSREVESSDLDKSQLESELKTLKNSAIRLVSSSDNLRSEAINLLTDSFQLEVLATVQISSTRARELTVKIDNLTQRLRKSNRLLSIDELQQQLELIKQKANSTSGTAKHHQTKLIESLERNIKLAQEGQDIRLAQVINLSTQIQDYIGTLQKLQTQLRTSDLSDSQQVYSLQLLGDELISLQDNIDLLARK